MGMSRSMYRYPWLSENHICLLSYRLIKKVGGEKVYISLSRERVTGLTLGRSDSVGLRYLVRAA